MGFRTRLTLASLVTCSGFLMGFLSLFQPPQIAFYMILACVLIDGLDGRLARFLKVESAFGACLDSFSDFFCFVIAPAVCWTKTFPSSLYVQTAAAFYALCMLVRFAYYKYQAQNVQDFFTGLPSNMASCFIFMLFYTGASEWTQTALIVCMGLLGVSSVKTPSLKGQNAWLFWPVYALFSMCFLYKTVAFGMVLVYIGWTFYLNFLHDAANARKP